MFRVTNGWTFALCALLSVGFLLVRADGQKIPKTSFSCDGRTSGYYADVSTGCQVYHMCDGLGRQFSYRCPSKTLFQQRMLICDHWYMVNCSKSEEDYSANLLIGQQNRAFVDDQTFHRTPRPDLADPGHSDYNVYQTGEQETRSTKNVVGADENQDPKTPTDDTEYFPPSHWSTEVSDHPTTATPAKREESGSAVQGFVKQTYYNTNYDTVKKFSNSLIRPKVKDQNLNSINRNDNSVNTGTKSIPTKKTANEQTLPPGVNFPSSFRATTPVYPKHLNIDLTKFTDFGNPLEDTVNNDDQHTASVNFPSKFKATTPVYPKNVEIDKSRQSEFDIPIGNSKTDAVPINFASNFKATTPVYPNHVNFDPLKLSEFDIPIENKANADFVSINFASKFKATTPVYPKHVDVDLSKFSGSEEVPPENSQNDVVVNFVSNFKATTPVYPQHVDVDLSKFLEPVELPKTKNTANKAVNFDSNFKATTPVYPHSVEATSPIPDEFGLLPPLLAPQAQANTSKDNSKHVNFASNFQATTPVYPKSVEATSPDPGNVGLLAPGSGQSFELFEPSRDIQPPTFESTFKRRIDEEDPSVTGNTFNSQQLTEFMLTIKPEQLRDLKQLWHIPDYDFPLDTASRPSYESDFSSFQAIPKGVKSVR